MYIYIYRYIYILCLCAIDRILNGNNTIELCSYVTNMYTCAYLLATHTCTCIHVHVAITLWMCILKHEVSHINQ